MVLPASSTGTTSDLPVTPDGRVRYEQLPPRRPAAEYRVKAVEPPSRNAR
jgi:hypothetical protein